MRSTYSFLMIALAGLCLGLAIPAHAASWCKTNTAPSIDIHTSTDEVSYNFSLSKKQLDTFEVSTVNPYASNVITDVGGLMKGGIETKHNTRFGTLTNGETQEICFWHEKMDIYIHIKPTIYIANEFPKGGCMFNAIMEHEQKHAIVDREIVNKYASLIGNAVRTDISANRFFGPVPLSQKDRLQATIDQRIQSLLGQYTTQMANERKTRQQKIDSLEEYERINHLCPKQ